MDRISIDPQQAANEYQVEDREDLLGGVSVIRAAAARVVRGRDALPAPEPAEIAAIPYYAWNHRGPGAMAVWVPRDPSIIKAPPGETLASASRASASHTWATDTPAALNDQLEPDSSGDHSIPRHTWWPHRGTTEWVQYDLPGPTEVRAAEVYWFDDTGVGQCRVPASWRLLYRAGDEWRDVPGANGYGVEKDRFNTVEFDPVTTTALRVEVSLREGFSGGVLEWRVR